MSTPQPTPIYGPSASRLRTEAFDRAKTHATNDIESILFIEGNDAQHDTHRDQWSQKHSPLQLTVCELSDVVRQAHGRLIAPIPEVDTLDRQRIIEQAVADSPHLEKPRQCTTFVAELINTFQDVRDEIYQHQRPDRAQEQW